jgi:hypothetical protein
MRGLAVEGWFYFGRKLFSRAENYLLMLHASNNSHRPLVDVRSGSFPASSRKSLRHIITFLHRA